MFSKVSNWIKQQNLGEKARRAGMKARDWYWRNRDTINVAAPFVLGGLFTTVKVVGKRRNLRKEEMLKNRYCYDRSLGHYWALKRDLSNREWLAIDHRRKKGERLANILKDMNVLR